MSVPDTPYFVKALDGKERWFEDMYPDSIQDALDQIDKNRTLTVAQKLNEKVKVLKTIDPAKYYAGWWASLFP
jgi:hypothetical protein